MPLCLDNMAGAKRKNWNRGRHASLASNAMHHEVGNLRGSCNRIQLYIYLYICEILQGGQDKLVGFLPWHGMPFCLDCRGASMPWGKSAKFARGVRMLKM